jgi:uncharacterized protein (DUF927 family)
MISAPGWYGRRFITRHKSYGQEDDVQVLLDPESPEYVSAFSSAGDLAGWRDAVREYPNYSAPLCVAMSAVFAAPLLRPLGMDSFGINWYGRTSGGKSTMLRAAAAVAGLFDGDGYNLPTWGDTDAAFEAQAMGHRDCFYPVDETGDADRNDVPLVIRSKRWAFALSRNRPRRTGMSYARANGLIGREFRIIGMSSSEVALGNLGRPRLGGEEVRLIDIPAELPGSFGIFDGNLGADAGDERARRLADKIKADAGRHQGVAFEAYIRALFEHKNWLARAKREIRRFEEAYVTPVHSRAAGRIRSNFAVLWAGAALAIRYRVLPWKKNTTMAAIEKCFERAINALPTAGNGQKAAIGVANVLERLSGYLDRGKLLRIKPRRRVSKNKVTARQAADGFYIDGDLYLKNDRLDILFLPPERAALKTAGAFLTQRTDTPTVPKKVYGIKGRRRYYRINQATLSRPQEGR